MKKFLQVTGLIIIFILTLTSCATKMLTMSPNEVKMMTTRQIEASKDIVFKAAISLLQSESYLISNANERVGLINASKRIENRNAASQRFFMGSSKDANTSKAVIYVEEFNSGLSEIKITLYEGSETTTTGSWGQGKQNKDIKESMLYDAQVYNNWFNTLKAEIERRKALTK